MRRVTRALLPLILTAVVVTGCGGGDGGGTPLPPSPVTVTLTATDALTGHVFSGGSVARSDTLRAGDNEGPTRSHGVRGFVSFDVAGIPPGATVLSATLTLFQGEVVQLPYASLGDLLVDHVVYGTVLEAGAYARSPLAAGIAVLPNDATLGFRMVGVTPQVQTDLVAAHPQSQYRVRFALEVDGDATSDQAVFSDAGVNSSVARRPTLVVTYLP
jgi:hypothetical protein